MRMNVRAWWSCGAVSVAAATFYDIELSKRGDHHHSLHTIQTFAFNHNAAGRVSDWCARNDHCFCDPEARRLIPQWA